MSKRFDWLGERCMEGGAELQAVAEGGAAGTANSRLLRRASNSLAILALTRGVLSWAHRRVLDKATKDALGLALAIVTDARNELAALKAQQQQAEVQR
jgi:hypothetical protein